MRSNPRERRRESGVPSAKRLRQISARFARTRKGAQAGRAGFVGFTPSLLQRSVVIVRWIPNRGDSRWRSYGRYLAREGAQQEGRPGHGFDTHENEIDVADRLGRWERSGDARLWKLIVSPEAGERLDLRRHGQELVTAMEEDLGIFLEWVGIAHFDTGHPHLHVVLRGRSQTGIDFRFPRDYLGHGIRLRSQELATQILGFRFERDLSTARERTVEARRYIDLDETLARRADAERRVKFEATVPSADDARDMRLQLLRRLGFLSELGLARRVGRRTFELSDNHRAELERIQLTRDLRRSLMRYGELLVDRHVPLRLTELVPGVELRGRVVGGAEQAGGRKFLVVEGMDDSLHVVPQTPEIEEHRDRDEVLRGEFITLRAVRLSPESERRVRVQITRHGRLHELEATHEPSTLLDLMAIQTVRKQNGRLATNAPVSGFRLDMAKAIARRLPLLEKHGFLKAFEQDGSGTRSRLLYVSEDAEERIEKTLKERERAFTSLLEVERSYGMPIEQAKLEPGRAYQGRVVAVASDFGGRAYVVLRTGPTLTAVPAAAQTLLLGRDVHAHAVSREVAGERHWVLAWQLDDLDLDRERDRGRGR